MWNPWDLHTDPQHGGTRQPHRGAGYLPCWTPTVPHPNPNPDQDTDCQIHWHHGCSLDPLHIPKLGLLRGQTYLVLTEPKYKQRVNKTDRAIPIRPLNQPLLRRYSWECCYSLEYSRGCRNSRGCGNSGERWSTCSPLLGSGARSLHGTLLVDTKKNEFNEKSSQKRFKIRVSPLSFTLFKQQQSRRKLFWRLTPW